MSKGVSGVWGCLYGHVWGMPRHVKKDLAITWIKLDVIGFMMWIIHSGFNGLEFTNLFLLPSHSPLQVSSIIIMQLSPVNQTSYKLEKVLVFTLWKSHIFSDLVLTHESAVSPPVAPPKMIGKRGENSNDLDPPTIPWPAQHAWHFYGRPVFVFLFLCFSK